jgi:hypothetical protein
MLRFLMGLGETRERVSRVTVSGVVGVQRGKVSHVVVSDGLGIRKKVSHVTVSVGLE